MRPTVVKVCSGCSLAFTLEDFLRRPFIERRLSAADSVVIEVRACWCSTSLLLVTASAIFPHGGRALLEVS